MWEGLEGPPPGLSLLYYDSYNGTSVSHMADDASRLAIRLIFLSFGSLSMFSSVLLVASYISVREVWSFFAVVVFSRFLFVRVCDHSHALVTLVLRHALARARRC